MDYESFLKQSDNNGKCHPELSSHFASYANEYKMEEDSCCIRIPSTACPQCQKALYSGERPRPRWLPPWRRTARSRARRWALGGAGPGAGAVADALRGHRRLLRAAAARRGRPAPGPAPAPPSPLTAPAALARAHLHLYDAYLRLLRLHAQDVRRLAAEGAEGPSLEELRRRLADDSSCDSGQSSPSSLTPSMPTERDGISLSAIACKGGEAEPAGARPSADADGNGDEDKDEDEAEAAAGGESRPPRPHGAEDKEWGALLLHHQRFLAQVAAKYTKQPSPWAHLLRIDAAGEDCDRPRHEDISDDQLREGALAVLRALDEALAGAPADDADAGAAADAERERDKVQERNSQRELANRKESQCSFNKDTSKVDELMDNTRLKDTNKLSEATLVYSLRCTRSDIVLHEVQAAENKKGVYRNGERERNGEGDVNIPEEEADISSLKRRRKMEKFQDTTLLLPDDLQSPLASDCRLLEEKSEDVLEKVISLCVDSSVRK